MKKLLEKVMVCIPNIYASSSLTLNSSCVLGNAMKSFKFYYLISTTVPDLVPSQPLFYRIKKSSLRKTETVA